MIFQKILELITGLKDFFVVVVDFNRIDTNDILDIHRYLMKET